MFVAEEKLAVQVAQIDCVQVDNMYLAETGENKVFKQLATNAPGAHHEHTHL